jgi:hypothetical protein
MMEQFEKENCGYYQFGCFIRAEEDSNYCEEHKEIGEHSDKVSKILLLQIEKLASFGDKLLKTNLALSKGK